MADEPLRKRKRRSTVTDFAKKRKKQAYNILFSKARIHTGTELSRWRELKRQLLIAKLAKLLLDRLQRLWNKKSGRWTAHAKKVPKDYGYVNDLQRRALKMRIKDKIGMRRKKELEMEDPRRISVHLAPVEPKSTREIMAEKVSRFK